MRLVRDVPPDPGCIYFDVQSPLRVRRRIDRQQFPVAAIVWAVCSAMVALYFDDWRWLPVAAAAFGLLMLGIHRLLHRVPRTTVYCRSCPGSGWIDDLRDSAGVCPLCGGDRFDYLSVRFTGVSRTMPLVAFDVSGAGLLERQRHGRYRHHYR